MSIFFKNHFTYLYIFLLIILTNCQLKDASLNHGVLYLENRSNKLKLNKSNTNDVIKNIGLPHSKSLNNDLEWIFIERIYTKGKFHKLGQNVLKTNNVLFLKFNKYGILIEKKLFNKEDLNNFKFSSMETSNDLSKKSFIESLFSSLKAKMYGNR